MSELDQTEVLSEERKQWSIRLTPSLVLTKAIWVPVICFALYLMMPMVLLSLPSGFLFNWYAKPILYLGNVFNFVPTYLIIWGALSCYRANYRISLMFFLLWFLSLMGSRFTVYDLANLPILLHSLVPWTFLFLGLVLWRHYKSWLVISPSCSTLSKFSEIRFSIRFLLTVTAAAAFMLAIDRALVFLREDPSSSFTRANLDSIVLFSVIGSVVLIPKWLLALTMLMDRNKILLRSLILILIQPLFFFLRTAMSYLYSGRSGFNLGKLLPFAFEYTLAATGIIVLGLALRWAGYRIVRQTDSSQPTEPLLAS